MNIIKTTHQQKIDELVNRDMDNIFSDYKDLEAFVDYVLRHGHIGYENENVKTINEIYRDIFEEE